MTHPVLVMTLNPDTERRLAHLEAWASDPAPATAAKPAHTAEQLLTMDPADLRAAAWGDGLPPLPEPDQHLSPEERRAYGEAWDKTRRRGDLWSEAEQPAEAQQAPLQPAPDASGDDRKRQQQDAPQAPAEADPLPGDLAGMFATVEAQLTAAAAPPTLPLSAQVLAQLRNMPGDQRDQLAARIAAEDYSQADYFKASGYSTDYTARLVSDALLQRFSDARRIEPELSPEQFLQRMMPGEEN